MHKIFKYSLLQAKRKHKRTLIFRDFLETLNHCNFRYSGGILIVKIISARKNKTNLLWD